jgi:hypothetical protein
LYFKYLKAIALSGVIHIVLWNEIYCPMVQLRAMVQKDDEWVLIEDGGGEEERR